jgi:hypothetical protein
MNCRMKRTAASMTYDEPPLHDIDFAVRRGVMSV